MKNSNFLIRKEYKFVLENKEVLNFFKFYSKTIKKLHPKRKIISLYFDTPDFQLYKNSILNDVDKTKIRFRQYPQKNSNIYKEIKINSQNGKEKLSELTEYSKLSAIKNVVHENSQLTPVIYIEYDREYFEVENSIRVTIDNNIYYSPPKNRSLFSKKITEDKTIVEFKLLDKSFTDVEKLFFKNPQAFSKFTNGMQKIYALD